VKESFHGLRNVVFLDDVYWPGGVRKLLSAADLYILASGLDCCPTTVLEASLMGKPVLASRVGGVPEIVVEGKTGWTINNFDTRNWIEKIRLLTEDADLASHMGSEGRRWVSEKFSWEKISRQVETILLEVAFNSK
jgi:glycosyltransferase involved in cell wall biosynthesis